jgi:hypothetical protein
MVGNLDSTDLERGGSNAQTHWYRGRLIGKAQAAEEVSTLRVPGQPQLFHLGTHLVCQARRHVPEKIQRPGMPVIPDEVYPPARARITAKHREGHGLVGKPPKDQESVISHGWVPGIPRK